MAQCVVHLLVHMLEPYKGRVFDPCCGWGGMLVSSEKFVEEHGRPVATKPQQAAPQKPVAAVCDRRRGAEDRTGVTQLELDRCLNSLC